MNGYDTNEDEWLEILGVICGVITGILIDIIILSLWL